MNRMENIGRKKQSGSDVSLETVERYGDLLLMPHHVSLTRPKMSLIERAAQFSPFAALTGYDAAIKETARQTEEFIELDENRRAEVNLKLRWLKEHLKEAPQVCITYFLPDEKKSGGAYVTAAGAVKKIDEYACCVWVEDRIVIPMEKIYEITGQDFTRTEASDQFGSPVNEVALNEFF